MEEQKKKERGIYLRKEGRWEARCNVGRTRDCKTIYEAFLTLLHPYITFGVCVLLQRSNSTAHNI